MKVLLLNPEDTPWSGEWRNSQWDLIVDLGWAGPDCYGRWAEQMGTRVLSLYDYQQPIEIFRKIREFIDVGCNQLVDSLGLDWWELQAAVSYEVLQQMFLLGRLRDDLGDNAEIYVTRQCLSRSAISHVWGKEIRYCEQRRSKRDNLRIFAKRVRKLSIGQMLEVAFDKWDADYQVRRRYARQCVQATEPVVLLPTPYVNVSRTLLAYAGLLPGRKFLLVATRKSGTWAFPPANVLSASLAAYAVPASQSRAEAELLIAKWHRLKRDLLPSVNELKWACDADLLEYIPSTLARGLCVRDAWQRLLEQEPVHGVLCADDLNIYTRIPLILAGRMGLRTIYCAHGALDSSLVFKQSYADVYLAKGEMERDYMASACGVPAERIIVGAPASSVPISQAARPSRNGSIIFFSQPYEVYAARADEAYREILPRLCEVARTHNCKVIVKLHPFESRRDRSRLLHAVLSESQWPLVEISKHRFASELFDKMWFGVSVSSSVALECTLERIPFFNCGWLEPKDTGYVPQFTKFGAGQILNHPDEIYRIPELLGQADFSDEVLRNLSQPIQDDTLDRIMFGKITGGSAAEDRGSPPKLMGRLLRHLVYPSLGRSGYLRRWRDRRVDTLAVVTYHGVLPRSYQIVDEFLDDGMLRTDDFRRQLRFFKSNYAVISPEVFRGWLLGQNDLPPRAVLLTCDDGLLNTTTDVLPVLLAEGLRCLFFISGDSLRNERAISWYLQLYLLLRSARGRPHVTSFGSVTLRIGFSSSREIRSTWWRLVRELSRHDADTRTAFFDHLRIASGLPQDWDSIYVEDPVLRQRYTSMSLAGLHQLVESGMTLGGHTQSHLLLAQSSDQICWQEIASDRDRLKQIVGKPVWALAYPFGHAGSIGSRELGVAERAGYECAFLNSGGCIRSLSVEQRFALPRLHVSARMGIAELEALVSGFDGSLRRFFAGPASQLAGAL